MPLLNTFREERAVPIIQQGDNNLCHVLALCSYLFGIGFYDMHRQATPAVLDSDCNVGETITRYEEARSELLAQYMKSDIDESFAAYCLEMLMKRLAFVKMSTTIEKPSFDYEFQDRNWDDLGRTRAGFNRQQYKGDGVFGRNCVMNGALINYAFQGGGQCDRFAMVYKSWGLLDQEKGSDTSPLNGGEPHSNLTNVLLIRGHVCESSSVSEDESHLQITTTHFTGGMSVVSVNKEIKPFDPEALNNLTSEDYAGHGDFSDEYERRFFEGELGSVLRKGQDLGITYGILGVPGHAVCAALMNDVWYVCDQTRWVMMTVEEYIKYSKNFNLFILYRRRYNLFLTALCTSGQAGGDSTPPGMSLVPTWLLLAGVTIAGAFAA
jgi:hypothetical protein